MHAVREKGASTDPEREKSTSNFEHNKGIGGLESCIIDRESTYWRMQYKCYAIDSSPGLEQRLAFLGHCSIVVEVSNRGPVLHVLSSPKQS